MAELQKRVQRREVFHRVMRLKGPNILFRRVAYHTWFLFEVLRRWSNGITAQINLKDQVPYISWTCDQFFTPNILRFWWR